jgi:hypothetical protein
MVVVAGAALEPSVEEWPDRNTGTPADASNGGANPCADGESGAERKEPQGADDIRPGDVVMRLAFHCIAPLR